MAAVKTQAAQQRKQLLVRRGLPYRLPDGTTEEFDAPLGWGLGVRDLERMLDDKLQRHEFEQRTTLKMSDWITEAKEGEVHLHVFKVFLDQCTSYKPFLLRVYGACIKLIASIERAAQRIVEVETSHAKVEAECNAVARTTIKTFDEKIEKFKMCVHDARREVEQWKAQAEEAEAKRAAIQATIDADENTRSEERQQCADYQRMAQEALSNLRTLQRKSQAIMDENTVLRKVAMYNEDLLREIEERKDEADADRARVAAHEQQQHASRGALEAELVKAREVLHSLTQQNRMRIDELAGAQDDVKRLQRELGEVTAERDRLHRTHTPRPSFSSPLADDDASTRARVDAIVTHNADLAADLYAQGLKLNAAEAVASFLKSDLDYYALRFDVPMIGGRPLFGVGVHPGVPAYLRCYGPVRNRHYSPTEARSLLNDLTQWAEANGSLDVTHPPHTIFDAWLKETKGKDWEQIEVAYSLLDASERMVNAGDVMVLKKWLDGHAPLKLYRNVSKFMSRVLEAFLTKARESKGGGKATMKRKVVTETFDGLFKKHKTESEYLRLKHAIARDLKRAVDTGVMRKDDVPWESVFFSTDSYGNSLDAVTVVREQYIAEIEEVSRDWEHLMYATGTDYTTKYNNRTVRYTSRRLVYETFLALDPHHLPDDVEALVAALIGSIPEKIHDEAAMPFSLVADRTRAFIAHNRTGRRVEVKKLLKALPQGVRDEQEALVLKLYPQRAVEGVGEDGGR